ncbi:MAG: hydroxysqualene dehydroxylase, partial [Terriglobia bacterium]
MSHETLIIGGGFAGLAAGVALAGAGRRVRLIEQRPYLGGRARSFRHAVTGATVDNGQHIFMGCYHETIKFLKTIGTLDRVRFQPRLSVHFVDRDEGITSLDCPALPAPWHLLAGVLKSNSFGFAEKMQVLRLGRSLRSTNPGDWAQNLDGLTVDDWMARLGQSEKLRRKFWDLLCIAALNEDPRIAAASVFEPVLRLALFQSASDSRIGLAAGGLSECYTEAAAAFIRAHRGEVGVGCQAFELLISGEDSSLRKTDRITCRGVRLADGSVVEGDAVISAV